MYLAPACFVWLMAGVAVVEWPAMRDNHALQLMLDKPFWYFAAAAMGFCVNLLAYMVIQTASSLTLKVLVKYQPPGLEHASMGLCVLSCIPCMCVQAQLRLLCTHTQSCELIS